MADAQAIATFQWVSRLEGMIPTLETAHTFAYLDQLCPTLADSPKIVLNCSGRGDQNRQTVAKVLNS